MDNSHYNKEIDSYLKEPENYKSALELLENIDRIDRDLLAEFWYEVTERLRKRIKLNEELKMISKYDKEVDNCEWFNIQKNDWEFYFISTEKEDVGIHRKKEFSEKDMAPYENLIKQIIEENKSLVGEFKNLNWPCWHTFNQYKFNDSKRKSRILPALRDGVINECVNLLFNYIDGWVYVCDIVNGKISGIRNSESNSPNQTTKGI